MAQRHFIQLAYNGAPFHGWQTQPGGVPTVQATLEQALATVLRSPQPIPVTGAGRTDTGVNASMMIAHFDWPQPLEGHRLVRSLNSLLAPHIAVYAITPVHQDAHARFDATSRTYHYHAHTYPSPFLRQFSWQAPATLDFQAMNQAAQLLLHVTDFTSFAKLHSNARTNICHLTQAQWVELAPGKWRFQITADRFLRNMVRATVGTLVDVGRHKLHPREILDVISRRDRCAAGTSMPPHPLFLASITYPYFTPVTTEPRNPSRAPINQPPSPAACHGGPVPLVFNLNSQKGRCYPEKNHYLCPSKPPKQAHPQATNASTMTQAKAQRPVL